MLKFTFKGHWDTASYASYYYMSVYPNPTASDQLSDSWAVNSCREFFVRTYRTIINGNNVDSNMAKKAYVLISYGVPNKFEFDEWCIRINEESQKGLFILNSFEKAHKWPLTKLYPVKCTNRDIPFVFFAGPRKWTMSPYLMSIWSLCIRLGRNEWLPKNLLTLDHENLVRQLSISAKSSTKHDAREVSYTMRKWDTFMSLYSKLFAGIDRKNHWSTTHLNGYGDRPEGIHKFLSGTSNYIELYKKYCELRKEPK